MTRYRVWIVLIVLNICYFISSDTLPGEILYADNGRIRGFSDREDKDIILAAIIPIHQHQGITCTNKIYLNETLDYVEAVLYSIDLINKDPNLLPNITLGYDIRDSCITESTAIEETVDLVLLSNTERCPVCSADGFDETNTSIPVSGIIGEYASFVSIPIANFLRLFNVPQVAFASTSTILNNREQYSYFYRTVPSDDQQAQAMIDLVLHFGWKYVSTIHSNDLYAEPGIDKFKQLASIHGICIDLDIGISRDFSDEQYSNVVDQIYGSVPSVIVFFSSLDQVVGLFERMQQANIDRKFLWIGSDIWVESPSIFQNYGNIVEGMWGTIPYTEPVPSFYSYLSTLTPSTNNRNPWFIEYYEEYNNCIRDINCSDYSITSNADYRNYSFTPFVIDAVFTFAHAINNFLNDNCPKPIVWNTTSRTCAGQVEALNGAALRQYLERTAFKSPTGNDIFFDSTGSINGIYRILNYQLNVAKGTYELVTAGIWNGTRPFNSRLDINRNLVLQFSVTNDGLPQRNIIESQCQQCSIGSVSKSIASSCCGSCSPCIRDQFTLFSNMSECTNCSEYMWGNNPLVGSSYCQSIEESYLEPGDPWGIFLIILATLGMISVVFFSISLAVFWNKPIIKASGREQMIFLLIGSSLSFLSTTFFLIKPSIAVCTLQRISTWLCFSIILSSLFVKLVRIARIFLRTQTSTRPNFTGPIAQIFFTSLLVMGQLILTLISLLVVYPDVKIVLQLNPENTDDFPLLLVQCTRPHIVLIALHMLYFSILLVLSNALAMLTIRFPANFKEALHVALSTFCIGIIWIAFIITYFASSETSLAAVSSFAIQMSALAVLMCTFGPRVFMLIFLPQKKQSSIRRQSTELALESLRKNSTPDLERIGTVKDNCNGSNNNKA